MGMKRVENEFNDIERAYYASKDTVFSCISISGKQDGESALKECQNIVANNCYLALRYPFWHDTGLVLDGCTLVDTCRAALWYSKNIDIHQCLCSGVKAVRECDFVNIENSRFTSEEFGWKTRHISVKNSAIISMYAFLESRDVKLDKVDFKGKYSFQYVENLTILDSNLDTKDAFWHCKNVYVKNSIIKGQYLAWYSENITLENCKIIGTQPLCYVKNLKLINCEFISCDLAFEYSEVNGNIIGTLDSIKNPISGNLTIDRPTELIIDENDRSEGKFALTVKNK